MWRNLGTSVERMPSLGTLGEHWELRTKYPWVPELYGSTKTQVSHTKDFADVPNNYLETLQMINET